MSKFSITVTPAVLIIKRHPLSFLRDLPLAVFGFLMSIMVFILPYDQLIAIHRYAYIVYFLPLLAVITCLNLVRKMVTRFEYILDRKHDILSFNHRRLDRLSNIIRVEWNIDSPSDHEKSYLELRSKNDELFRISAMGSYLNKEHLKLGREIAKFLKIEFVNNNPLEKEILWGDVDMNEASIRQIENQF